MKTNRPNQAWAEYRQAIYGTGEPLGRIQERECSLAFYAGMRAAFEEVAVISACAADDEEGALAIEQFRQEINAAAARANLDRSDGKS